MRTPAPDALLVDHPAVPVPVPHGDELALLPQLRPLVAGDTPRRQRLLLAVQLVAAVVHLLELDLWPGIGALRRAGVAAEQRVPQAVLAGVPVPLSPLLRRLGGGEGALRELRDRVVAAVSAATGLEARVWRSLRDERSPFLDPWLARGLAQLKLPLDSATARALWCVQLRLPPLPVAGDVAYWPVPDGSVAKRVAAAARSAAARSGRATWWMAPIGQQGATAPLPTADSSGLLVVAGELGEVDLASAERWAARPGCAAVAIGSFPAGWNPAPPPLFDEGGRSHQLRLAGLPADQARREVERRTAARFNPLHPSDRAALTTAAEQLFRDRENAGGGLAKPEMGRLESVLGLLPEGLPEGFAILHGAVTPSELQRQAADGRISLHRARWRLADPVPLGHDPLHREVAGLFPEDDPRRLRHLMLAGDDSASLAGWARQRLDELDGSQVRAILAPVDPEAMAPELLAMHAEACLLELDLSGLRRAAAALPPPWAGPWRQCAAVLDAPDWTPVLPSPADAERAPRAVVEIALRALRTAVRRGQGDGTAARELLDHAETHLGSAARGALALRRALVDEPTRLADSAWRRAQVGAHPRLRREWLRCRALSLVWRGEHRRARRLLQLLLSGERSPGRLGLVHLDLGAVAQLEGHSVEAEHHHLRAVRLLEAAGFCELTRLPLFNLGVADLDRLDVRGAEERLCAAADATDPALGLELARLALARGDESELRRRLAELTGEAIDPGIGSQEANALLCGAVALLDGDHAAAEAHFASGGQEGRAWLALTAALKGRHVAVAREDDWGVVRCARLVSVVRAGEPPVAAVGAEDPELPDAFALALLERLLGRQPWVAEESRRAAERRLRTAGLDGWARRLAASPAVSGVFEAFAGLLEGVELTTLPPARLEVLLAALGVGGLEVRAADGSGERILRVGRGDPGTPQRYGRVVVVPLGGEVQPGGAWRLLGAALQLAVPVNPDPDPDAAATGIHGISPATVRLRRELRALAGSSVPVVLLGETGVGKEVAARAVHVLSGREGEIVPVNVAAIPATLLEADLFGVVRGAFTGADRSRRGLVDTADGGTLFLDEIGDLDPSLQVKLLRFLESQEVRPVGGAASHRVDVRVVAATHRDLRAAVRAGTFREDLFYRVASAEVTIPPLRERPEDIPVLKALFEEQAVVRDGLARAPWSPAAEECLRAHTWPGNVRELKHVVQVAMVRAAGSPVLPEHLPLGQAKAPQRPVPGGYEAALAEFRRRILSDALNRHHGNRSAAARELGISRQTLLYHIRSLGIDS